MMNRKLQSSRACSWPSLYCNAETLPPYDMQWEKEFLHYKERWEKDTTAGFCFPVILQAHDGHLEPSQDSVED